MSEYVQSDSFKTLQYNQRRGQCLPRQVRDEIKTGLCRGGIPGQRGIWKYL
jgi:hypothetical protein